MATSSESKPMTKNWRFPLAMGASIGLGIATARSVEQNLVSSIGQWAAFCAALLAAALVAGLVNLVVVSFIKPGDGH